MNRKEVNELPISNMLLQLRKGNTLENIFNSMGIDSKVRQPGGKLSD